MNTEFGRPELLPFDLRNRRVIAYQSRPEASERAPDRKQLESLLESHLRSVLPTIAVPAQPVSAFAAEKDAALLAITGATPNRDGLVRKSLDTLWREMDALAPAFPGTPETSTDEKLVEALQLSIPLVRDFSLLSEGVAMTGSQDLAKRLFRSFGSCVEHYRPPMEAGANASYIAHADFYRFIGHEMLVTAVAHLLREERWTVLSQALSERLYVNNTLRGPDTVEFYKVSEYMKSLEIREQRLTPRRVGLRSELLRERHTSAPLQNLASSDEFYDADMLLYLRAGMNWKPWGFALSPRRIPKYLIESRRMQNAEQLLSVLESSSIDEFKELLSERKMALSRLSPQGIYFLDDFNAKIIGTT